MKGSYVILIKNNSDQKIQIGKLGNIFFKKGNYVYVGSAMSSLEKRINRHLSKNKKMHWHIDYLLTNTKILGVFYNNSKSKEECTIAHFFKKYFFSIKDFGSSDCKCNSHLFYGEEEEFKNIIDKLDMNKYRLSKRELII